MTTRRWLVPLLAFVVPAIAYLAIITRGTFDLFGPVYAWQAYNYLALALADGRQDIPAEAIAAEGVYIGGKVYMYYGIIPALLRIPLMPFLDLREVPVSRLVSLFMLLVGQFAMQWTILRVAAVHGRTAFIDRFVTVALSIILWFGSAAMLLLPNPDLYYQPYSAAHMVSSVFFALLVYDLLVVGRAPRGARLMAYAVLAGLGVYTRQTYAIGLYAVTLVLLLPDLAEWRRARGPALGAAVRAAVLPLFIMFLAGCGYLALAYARSGHLTTGWSVDAWGFSAIVPRDARMISLDEQQFSPVRIIPNFVYFMVGGPHWREPLIEALGGGTVRTLSHPFRYLVYTPLALLIAGAGLWALLRRPPAPARTIRLVGAMLAIPAMLQLAYGTVFVRYSCELWPGLWWLMLVALRQIDPAVLFGRRQAAGMAAMAALLLVSAGYVATRPATFWYTSGNFEGSLSNPLPAVLAARATAPGSRDPTIAPTRARVGSGVWIEAEQRYR
ncbi:hypothetical protein [Sandarakinorhabdus sp. DWP1-3-1]|uniref:hypothetical protein n=1 Tax=Sandarakinorhabdus sp. DWP1-3-1 TaxID=2804627 RepID=UPI003CECCD7D